MPEFISNLVHPSHCFQQNLFHQLTSIDESGEREGGERRVADLPASLQVKRRHDTASPHFPHLQLVDVLRTRNNKAPLFQSSHIKADEVKDGTFEEIILDMKKKPFRAEQNGNGPAGEHMRKSFREEREL